MKRKIETDATSDNIKSRKVIRFGSTFRKKLKTDGAINALKEFVVANKETDVVTEYINVGGNAKELVTLLKRFDGKKNLIVANSVFAALECVIVKSVDELLLIQKDVEEACDELLCAYQITIQNMLSSSASTTSYKKTVLKLLTSMVRLSVGLAKKILALFPTNAKLLKVLTDPRASSSAAKLRKCFIPYLLSFLIEENVFLISDLLKKKGLLASIVPGLLNDKPETVILVLDAFRLKVVENVAISKTLKMHLFNTPVLRILHKLYDYEKEIEYKNNADGEYSANSSESVRMAVHSLLLLLCTSSKKGMLFRDRNTTSEKSRNNLILTLLEDIVAPWKNDLKTELVTEILKVCPEFSKIVFKQLELFLPPSNTEDWSKLITFLKKIIYKQEPHPEISNKPSVLTHITSSFFPGVVQKLLRDYGDGDLHQNPMIRFQILSLLEACLFKMSTFIDCCKLSTEYSSILSPLKEHIEEFLNQNSISCAALISEWNAEITTVDLDQYFNILEYYHSLANVLLLYAALCPIAFDQLRVNEDICLKEIENSDLELRFKRARLMYFIIEPKPGHAQFSSLLRQFIYSYIKDSCHTENQVLENMFLMTGFFEGYEREIVIWMHCIQKIPLEHCSIISDLLVDVFAVTSKEYKKFINDLMEASCEDEMVFCEDTNLLLNLEYFIDVDDGLERFSKPLIMLSPVIPALLVVLKTYELSAGKNGLKNPVQSFVSRILLHLLHLQSNPNSLVMLFEKYPSSYIDSHFIEYINFWNRDKLKTKSFMYPLPDENAAFQLCAIFGKAKRDIEVSSVLMNVSDSECILLWNFCMYYSSQLHKKLLLVNERYELVKKAFLILGEKLSLENKIQCLKFLITDSNFINSFDLAATADKNSLFILLVEVSLHFKRQDFLPHNYSKLLSPYRQRLLLFLLNKQYQNEDILLPFTNYAINDVIRFVMFSGKTTVSLLNSLSFLSANMFVTEDNSKLSEWCTTIQCLLDVAAEDLHPMQNESVMSLLSKIPELLQRNMSVDELEASIITYLRSFPHHIAHIPEDLITKLVEHHPEIDKIALHLLSFYPKLEYLFLNKILLCGVHMKINELLEIATKMTSTSTISNMLGLIRIHHFPVLISWIDGTEGWDVIYANLVQYFFQMLTDEEVCSDLCKQIEKKWSTVLVNSGTCVVMNTIFEKGRQLHKLVQLLISKLISMLTSSCENVSWLCSLICDIVKYLQNFNSLLSENVWADFIKSALKISLQTANSTLLHTLKIICSKVLTADDLMEINTIFEMTISHSEFFNIMSSNCKSEVKCELIEFYMLLITKNKSIMSSAHVPLLLSSYHATLSKSDQLLLQVLQWYESNEIRVNHCQPYLWGEAAALHHNIRAEISVSLKRQPQPNQVLELLDMEIVKNTIRFAPLFRSLQPENEIHLINVEVYDLSFMLPLMSHLLAPESRISIQKFTRSGALALVLIALSNKISDVRLAAFLCLQQFHLHLNSREKEIQIWNQFTEALKNAVLTTEHETVNEFSPPTLSCIVTSFLAHMSLIISEPLDSLFIPLYNFLSAKNSFDVNAIPNFLALFYSTEMQNRDHQIWILKIIKDGMRCEQDWIIAQKCFLFKLLLQYHSSASSNESINMLIMDILCNAVQIPACRVHLISKFGLLSWLSQLIQSSTDFNRNFLLCLVSIFQSLKKVKSTNTVIFIFLLLLRKLDSKKLDHQQVENLFEILSSLYARCKATVMTKTDFLFIIDFAKHYHSSNFDKICRNCLTYSSIVGVKECDNNITTYLIRMIRRFLCNC